MHHLIFLESHDGLITSLAGLAVLLFVGTCVWVASEEVTP